MPPDRLLLDWPHAAADEVRPSQPKQPFASGGDGAPPPSTFADSFQSIPRGILRGLASTASGSGQAAQIEMQQPIDVPDGDEATNILEQNVTGRLHRPQGPGGAVGANFGEALGNPLTYLFPGGIGTKLLAALTGALGSEAAGQFTKGTSSEPFARFGGALLGGGLGASVAQRGAAAVRSAANAVRASSSELADPFRPSISPDTPQPPITPPKLRIGDDGPPSEVAPHAQTVRENFEPSVGRGDLDEFRARKDVHGIHTVAVARTNVPGLETKKFEGGSPLVRKKAGLPRAISDGVQSPSVSRRYKGHAEEDVANQFIRAVKALGLKPSDLEGRTLAMHISNPRGVCWVCFWGINNKKRPGVLKQLSHLYPGLYIRVTVETQPGIIPHSPVEFTIHNEQLVSWRK